MHKAKPKYVNTDDLYFQNGIRQMTALPYHF